jgi:hypothetical protein
MIWLSLVRINLPTARFQPQICRVSCVRETLDKRKQVVMLATSAFILACGAIAASAQQSAGNPMTCGAPTNAQQAGIPATQQPNQTQLANEKDPGPNEEMMGHGMMGHCMMGRRNNGPSSRCDSLIFANQRVGCRKLALSPNRRRATRANRRGWSDSLRPNCGAGRRGHRPMQ